MLDVSEILNSTGSLIVLKHKNGSSAMKHKAGSCKVAKTRQDRSVRWITCMNLSVMRHRSGHSMIRTRLDFVVIKTDMSHGTVSFARMNCKTWSFRHGDIRMDPSLTQLKTVFKEDSTRNWIYQSDWPQDQIFQWWEKKLKPNQTKQNKHKTGFFSDAQSRVFQRRQTKLGFQRMHL